MQAAGAPAAGPLAPPAAELLGRVGNGRRQAPAELARGFLLPPAVDAFCAASTDGEARAAAPPVAIPVAGKAESPLGGAFGAGGGAFSNALDDGLAGLALAREFGAGAAQLPSGAAALLGLDLSATGTLDGARLAGVPANGQGQGHYTCEACGKETSTLAALNGHRRFCDGGA